MKKVRKYDFEMVVKEKEFGNYVEKADYLGLLTHTRMLMDSIEAALTADEISGPSKLTLSSALKYLKANLDEEYYG